MSFSSHSLSPAELASLLEAERSGGAFLAYREAGGDLRIEPLRAVTTATLGRDEHNNLVLAWDAEVSRTHAQLELIGGEWALVDDGLSRNGSFVNGERIAGRRRLADGDVIRVGRTSIVFRAPGPSSDSTAVAGAPVEIRLTAGELRVLVALCRPMTVPGSSAVPAGNKEIADQLNLTPDGVKSHVRALFAKLGIEDLPQYRKRTELARRALELGLVTRRELDAAP